MTIIHASMEQLDIVRSLLERGHHRRVDLGDEDLAAAVAHGEALLGLNGSGAWGVIVLSPEAGAMAAETHSIRRVYLRGAAFRQDSSPSMALRDLFDFYSRQVHRQRELVIGYGGDGWYERALAAAGFRLAEQVVYYELTGLSRRTWPTKDAPASTQIRDASPTNPADLEAVIAVDGAAFHTLWRLSARDLRLLQLMGQMFVADCAGNVVGYLAQTTTGPTVYVARLAVLPQHGGHGIGRRLLVAGLERARAAGCERAILNTQASNEPAQRLYRSLGFRRTGEQRTIFTLELAPTASPISGAVPNGDP